MFIPRTCQTQPKRSPKIGTPSFKSCLLLLSLGVHIWLSSLQAEDWPRWRGPRSDGTWRGPRLAQTWPQGGLQRQWVQSVGSGYSGVTVAGNRVVTMDRLTKPAEVERVLCFDAGTGDPDWVYQYPVEYGDLQYGSGPRSAPTIFQGRVYSLGAMGNLTCLDARDGSLIWAVDLRQRYQGRPPTWGYAASPLIFGDALIVQPGGPEGNSLVALDRRSGSEIWKNLQDQAAYATPIIIQRNDRQQLISWSPSHIRGLDPQSGELLWKIPYEMRLGVSIASPIFVEDLVIVSAYWKGSKAIRLGSENGKAELLWEENRFLRALMSPPLHRAGYGYLLDKRHGLTCFELTTGKKIWDDSNQMTPSGQNPHASLVWLNDQDRAIILNSDGDLILARLNPDGYQELTRANIIGKTWAHPAYTGTSVYARSDTELVSVKLPLAEPEE